MRLKRLSKAVVLSTFVLGAACGSAAAVGSSLGRATVLHVGEVAEFEEAGLRVGFTGVRDDSRCPPPDTGVVCVWEGSATVVLWAETGSRPRAEILVATSNAGDHSTTATYSSYEIELVSLEPPHVGETKQSEYSLTLLVRQVE